LKYASQPRFITFAPEISTMFNKRIKIKELLLQQAGQQGIVVMGWVRTFRNNQFIALNDGSTNANLQIVASLGEFNDELL